LITNDVSDSYQFIMQSLTSFVITLFSGLHYIQIQYLYITKRVFRN